MIKAIIRWVVNTFMCKHMNVGVKVRLYSSKTGKPYTLQKCYDCGKVIREEW